MISNECKRTILAIKCNYGKQLFDFYKKPSQEKCIAYRHIYLEYLDICMQNTQSGSIKKNVSAFTVIFGNCHFFGIGFWVINDYTETVDVFKYTASGCSKFQCSLDEFNQVVGA